MAELVSPCCGHNYSDHCDDDINEYFQCNHCEEYFEEPEKDYEYAERMHDSHLEARMDEKKLGL